MENELNVLLVDDDEDEYILLRDVFNRLPGKNNGKAYSLDWASTYEQALSICADKAYDIYLVDYHLGQYNGLDFMRAAEERGCNGPFILLTGQGSYELDLAAMQQGVSDYLLKDQVNEYLLERSIRYALEQHYAQATLERRVRERTAELAATNEELKREISRREQVEETLRESETRFRALAETTSAAIFIVQDGKIRYANPAARFVTGYLPDELLGMELWRLAHAAYQAPLRESRLVSHWAENVPARYELKILTRSGQERWVDMTAGKMQYAGQPAWVFTAFDITERDMAEQALRKARDELEARVAQRTAEIHAANQRLQTVLRTLPVGMIIADPDGQIIEGNSIFQALWDADEPLPDNIHDWGELKAWWVETGEPLALDDWPLAQAVLQGRACIGQVLDIETAVGQRKTIIHSAVPILDSDGSVAGGVAVAQDITHQRQLEQAAQAHARDAQQRADELEGLHRATATLLSTLDLDKLLCQILDAAQSAIPAAEKGMLHLVSPTTGELQVRATLGFSDNRIRVIHSTKGPSYPARVARERKPLLVADTTTGTEVGVEMTGATAGLGMTLSANAGEVPVSGSLDGLPAEMSDVRSIILAPLYFGEQVLGTLSLSAAQPGAFNESNLRLLASFAATTTAALQNAILHAEIKHLAVTDPLTGLYNRRAFFDLGQRELERFLRFNHPLTALMIDLDRFKEINDTYGHATGDLILRTLAERVRSSIRETDIFGRYGGDEFALLLPETDLFVARHIAGRIRDTVAGAPWLSEQGVVPVSVSLGVAGATKRHRILEDLLADADQALYQAKTGGRNRVEVLEISGGAPRGE